MEYLLFISYGSGLKHNCVYKSLDDAVESIKQLLEEEGLNASLEQNPSSAQLIKHLSENDDFYSELSNGTWYHLQTHPVFAGPDAK